MSAKRLVAIIGRPNVGKSTLFNRLIGRRQALVHDRPGVTRDRLYGTCWWDGHEWMVVDTGGIDPHGDALTALVTDQSRQALDAADGVLCVFDGREGLTTPDAMVAQWVRETGKPALFVINKCEGDEERALEFASLGIAPLYPVSAEHGVGVDAVLDALKGVVPAPVPPRVEVDDAAESDAAAVEPEARALHVAIIGRPNAGKSTLVNFLCGSERVVASPSPGTTRDVIDVQVERDGATYVFLDTAGIRRRAKMDDALEKFSVLKSLRSMERADVVVLIVDALEGASHQDRSLLAEATAHGRPTLLLLNKWDLVDTARVHKSRLTEATQEMLGELGRVPIVCGSAQTGDGLDTLWRLIRQYGEAGRRRLSTSALNRIIAEAQQQHQIPSYRGHLVKIAYATQVGHAPPRVLCFTNFPDGVPESYRRYLLKRLEAAFDAPGLPIELAFRKKR